MSFTEIGDRKPLYETVAENLRSSFVLDLMALKIPYNKFSALLFICST